MQLLALPHKEERPAQAKEEVSYREGELTILIQWACYRTSRNGVSEWAVEGLLSSAVRI